MQTNRIGLTLAKKDGELQIEAIQILNQSCHARKTLMLGYRVNQTCN